MRHELIHGVACGRDVGTGAACKLTCAAEMLPATPLCVGAKAWRMHAQTWMEADSNLSLLRRSWRATAVSAWTSHSMNRPPAMLRLSTEAGELRGVYIRRPCSAMASSQWGCSTAVPQISCSC